MILHRQLLVPDVFAWQILIISTLNHHIININTGNYYNVINFQAETDDSELSPIPLPITGAGEWSVVNQLT